jgi:hypothetical protein
MRSKVLLVLATAAVSAVLVPAAAADKPVKEPAPFGEAVTGQFCADFLVEVDVVADDEFSITFGSGRALIAGRFTLEVTNLESGESVTVNVSGPVFFDASGETAVLRGNSLIFGEAGDFGPGSLAGVVVTSGTVTFVNDVPGYTLEGTISRDLCAELAA